MFWQSQQTGGLIVNSDRMVSIATAVMEEKEQEFLDGLIKALAEKNTTFTAKKSRSYLMTYLYLGRYDIDLNTHLILTQLSQGAKPFKASFDKFAITGKSNSLVVRLKIGAELKKLAGNIRSSVRTTFPNPPFEAQITLGTLAEGTTLKDVKTPSLTGKSVTISGLRLVNAPVLNVENNRDRGYSWIPKSERPVRKASPAKEKKAGRRKKK